MKTIPLILLTALSLSALAWTQPANTTNWVWVQSPQGPVLVQVSQPIVDGSATASNAPNKEQTEQPPAEDEAAKKKKEEEEAAKKKQARLQKLQGAKFQRTVGAILDAWALDNNPEPPGSEEKKEEEKAEGEEGNKEEEKKEPTEEEKLAQQIQQWQRDVTLGNWDGVAEFLASLEEEEAKAAYQAMLNSLQQATPVKIPELDPALAEQLARIRMEGRTPEPNSFTFDDVMGVIRSTPADLEDDSLNSIGRLLNATLQSGNVVDPFLDLLEEECSKPEKKRKISERQAAKVLQAANQQTRMDRFLPDIATAEKEKDYEGLNLLSNHYLRLYYQDREPESLDKSWEVTQAVLRAEGVSKQQQDAALKQAIQLSVNMDPERGEAWLEESFAKSPERGTEIIRVIGAAPPANMQNRPSENYTRRRELELQSTAVETLLRVAPEQAQAWGETLHLLAMNWLREAKFSYEYDYTNNYGSSMRRDRYGNIYYTEEDRSYASNRVRPIDSDDVLEIKPSEDWLAHVESSSQPEFQKIYAQLYLKIGKEDEAFPYIEEICKSHPDDGTALVNEFLRIWTRNHDPNANQNRTSYYMYMYGYERKAESIPLTRSKQERNLEELSEVVKRLRALPLEDLNESLLARAFTTCHSSAEVYRREAIEEVFGSLDALEPETLSELIQQMRANLVTVWRSPAEQKDKKTNRKQKDIEAEVMRGYEVCKSVTETALKKYPESWRLQLARAAILHDENNYHQELDPDSEYTGKRLQSLDGFAKAAELYAAEIDELSENEETTLVYELWYYASLGASDLGMITDEMVADTRQPKLIREAMEALPEERAERHLAMFANAMFARMSAVKPAVKYRYLKGGFEIVGDHEQAAEAKDVFDYYNDLVTEIQLVAEIDGSDQVGHEEPFGVFVNLRHTKEIERESGGFGRYLQNQNSGGYYYYNYGRPLENYRDKFEQVVRQAMEEQFEILSVTFQREDVNSRAVQPYGWRETPYAYVLLKARGPEVDRIPSVRLDLDFLDTSGYAVLPVESPIVPIDASGEADPRPVEKLTITQTLDERQAEEGKLILEVQASAQGLVPDWDEILNLQTEEFEIADVEDQGLSVVQFDPEAMENVVLSERSWMVTMQAREDLAASPASFSFAEPLVEGAETTYQRYVDADLASVEPTISLEEAYANPSYTWIYLLVGGLLLGGLGWVFLRKGGKTPETAASVRYQLPEQITPFTVLGLLKQIERENGFESEEKEELEASIATVEGFYFHEKEGAEEPELKNLAEQWVLKAG